MAILIQNISNEEQTLIESILKRMKISFETTDTNEKVVVSAEEMDSIKIGLAQANKGLLTTSEEVHQQARKICSK